MHNEKRKTSSEKIADHLLHLKMLSTIDVDFTDILQQRIDSLQLHEKQILQDGPLYDPPIAETSSYVGNLEITQLYQFDEIIQKADDLENKISQKIKEGQLDEIKKLQENSPEHSSDLKILEKLVNNKDTPVQTIDDKIAQLRRVFR